MAHDTSPCDGEFLRLRDLSPRDISWNKVKTQARMVANAYAGTEYDKYYHRMDQCAGLLMFALVPLTTGEVVHRLQSAKLCHVRHCPVCQWRVSLMWRARLFRVLPRIINDYPGKRFCYLTLTVKNCDPYHLGETLTWMNEAWQRLSQRKSFPALGWLKATEITRGKDGTAHPHFHVLMIVNSGYFTKYYISQKRWRELWAEALRIDYDPQVDIKVVKPRVAPTSTAKTDSPSSEPEQVIQLMDNELQKAVRYTLKYSTKPNEFLIASSSTSQEAKDYQKWLVTITSQLHKRKAVSTGGIFRDYLKEQDPQNLVVDEENNQPTDTQDEDPRIIYAWQDEVLDYLLADKQPEFYL